ncbi:kinesin-like protein KIF23 [Drosophila eugracilis]|uniref:kinesin-like protein KIF23 n=1 Tax=Drosophila eugracilis TaxID=29029 RepID=UPI0007E85A44|nr:kinesin-like protein KIF23 [Drosophila eugracilis]XP_017064990.1 kinesin-like protein KIF23 [Drosophila eugracilis]XP_041674812.1 kinesin-like protein KIF23 [Drosophila eugracilis]XP_041674813.1 kinesin-like protein KIF23 [Drosophila eugracilis]
MLCSRMFKRSQSMNREPRILQESTRNKSECRGRSQSIDLSILKPLDPRRIRQQMFAVYVRVRPADELRKETDRPWMSIRPPNSIMVDRAAMLSASEGVASGASVAGSPGSPTSHEIEFRFRRVFSERASQGQVFKTLSESIFQQMDVGGNGLILVTGAPGTGKTHTIFGSGNKQDPGYLRRTFDTLFRSAGRDLVERYLIQANPSGAGFQAVSPKTAKRLAAQGDHKSEIPNSSECHWQVDGVKIRKNKRRIACFLGILIVQEGTIYDLFEKCDERPTPMTLRDDRTGRCYAVNANRLEIRNTDEALNYVKVALQKREALNFQGSTHLVINIYMAFYENGHCGKPLEFSQMTIVEVMAPRAHQLPSTRHSCSTLQSVYTLHSCLSCLHENQMAVIKGKTAKKRPPIRETSLTQLLRHFFHVSTLAHVVCLATISPEREQMLENMRSLRFAVDTIYSQEGKQPATKANVTKDELVSIDNEDNLGPITTFLDKHNQLNHRAIRSVIPIVLPCFLQIGTLLTLLKSHIVKRKKFIQSSENLSRELLARFGYSITGFVALQEDTLVELRTSNQAMINVVMQLEMIHEPLNYGTLSVQAQQMEKKVQITENLLRGRNQQLKIYANNLESKQEAENNMQNNQKD